MTWEERWALVKARCYCAIHGCLFPQHYLDSERFVRCFRCGSQYRRRGHIC
jgi:hypothetical protein